MKQQDKTEFLRQWRDGTISAENRRSLELAAMEDDFLFEAMDGLSDHVSSNLIAQDISDKLFSRVSKQRNTKVYRKLWFRSVAAAASILLVASLFWWNNSGLDTKQMASVEANDEVLLEDEIINEGENVEYADLMEMSESKQEGQLEKKKLSNEGIKDFMAQKPSAIKKALRANDNRGAEVVAETLDEEDIIIGDLNYEESLGEDIKNKEVILADEIAEDVTPVEEELIVVNTSMEELAESKTEAKPAKKKAQKSEAFKSNTTASEPNYDKIRYEFAPERGWELFDRYIEENRQKNVSALRASIKGRVVVQFNLDEDGYPMDLRIIESNWSGLNENALELIRSGGKWNTNDRTKSIRYIVEYP